MKDEQRDEGTLERQQLVGLRHSDQVGPDLAKLGEQAPDEGHELHVGRRVRDVHLPGAEDGGRRLEGMKRHRAQQLHVGRGIRDNPQSITRTHRPHLEQERPHDYGAAEEASRRPAEDGGALTRGDELMAQLGLCSTRALTRAIKAQLGLKVLDPGDERARPLFGSSKSLEEALNRVLNRARPSRIRRTYGAATKTFGVRIANHAQRRLRRRRRLVRVSGSLYHWHPAYRQQLRAR